MGTCSSCEQDADEELQMLVVKLVPLIKPILITELQTILTAIQLELKQTETPSDKLT